MLSLSKRNCIVIGLIFLIVSIIFYGLIEIKWVEIKIENTNQQISDEKKARIEIKRMSKFCDEQIYATVEVTNNTLNTVSFRGHYSNSPIFSIEKLHINSWVDIDGGFCVKGLKWFDIKPGDSTYFLARIDTYADKDFYRISIGLIDKTSNRSFSILSEPYELKYKEIENKCKSNN